MKVSLAFKKLEGSTVTPVTIGDAFRLMVLEYVPHWNTPVIDLKNKEIFFSATLVNPNEPKPIQANEP